MDGFYTANENDYQFIEKIVEITPNTEYRFKLEENPDVRSFLNKKNGWMTMKADNPFIHGYYFNFHSSGSVAGDHWF